ncbi:hypothetical protein D6779_05270 [Candidatus Parcubacteria bacterium]|nr:MAG: hypothetical protein D6779_05270 [Candidatus Parcubacteria bacterium]
MTSDELALLEQQWRQEREEYALLERLLKETGLTKKRFAELCGMSDRMLRYKLSSDSAHLLTFAEWHLLRTLARH